jgi:hypothetical protein
LRVAVIGGMNTRLLGCAGRSLSAGETGITVETRASGPKDGIIAVFNRQRRPDPMHASDVAINLVATAYADGSQPWVRKRT